MMEQKKIRQCAVCGKQLNGLIEYGDKYFCKKCFVKWEEQKIDKLIKMVEVLTDCVEELKTRVEALESGQSN